MPRGKKSMDGKIVAEPKRPITRRILSKPKSVLIPDMPRQPLRRPAASRPARFTRAG